MCTQVAVDGEELATAPGKVLPITMPGGAVRPLPLSKPVFARQEQLRRMWRALPCADEAGAFAAARQHVMREHGSAQSPWIYSAFARGFVASVTRFAERNPGFDESRPVNEETNPFHLWFDVPEGLIMPIILSVDTYRWNEQRRDGLRVVANIVTRTASLILPEHIHGREPFFMRPEEWLRAEGGAGGEHAARGRR